MVIQETITYAPLVVRYIYPILFSTAVGVVYLSSKLISYSISFYKFALFN